MTNSRRQFLRGSALAAGASITMSMFPEAIRKALAIPAHRRTGTLRDVEHIVILMQENRSFDHYFGTLRGVRGFGDRFPIPRNDAPGIAGKTVWYQTRFDGSGVVAPFPLNTTEHFEHMRVNGTPHTWPDATQAWADGRLDAWPRFKQDHALGYFTAEDLPFQFAMAEAFTLCDAYHCSFHGGTNPNRCFLWTGTNDPLQQGHGPALYNDYDNTDYDPEGGYSWLTYCERLQRAGISWQIYQNMDDNFTDNSVAGFRTFRAAYQGLPGALAALKERGLSTRDLDKLIEDVIDGKLPQVSWIVATAEGSEHPGPSSPAQGADYTAAVLDALTANPDVWSKTVFLVNFDENDGFFDHVPPPSVPSYLSYDADAKKAKLAGASTVDTRGEYHEFLPPEHNGADEQALLHRPYGLGPRVPLYVLSPWSKGGWVNSQVADHTSVIRLIEKRFGVAEPNISAWRRAVCSDLTSAFNFGDPDDGEFFEEFPETLELAERARALPGRTTPPTPSTVTLPAQELGARPSRALPYELSVTSELRPADERIELSFSNTGRAAAVFHVYDRLHLDRAPRRYTVEPRKSLSDRWTLGEGGGRYDLWILGPNGFHRHLSGDLASAGVRAPRPEIEIKYRPLFGAIAVELNNRGLAPCTFVIEANEYFSGPFRDGPWTHRVAALRQDSRVWTLKHSGYWYDFTVRVNELPGFARRFAGRVETGRDSWSDPALGGVAIGEQAKP